MHAVPEPLDVDDVIRDPTRYFSRPCEVLEHAALTRDQKRRILESWALDAELLSAAEAENMRASGDERPLLREARLALGQLAD